MNRSFTSGMICGVLVSLFGCAAAVVYPYYGMNLPVNCYTEGNAIGKPGSGGWPNFPMSECAPDATNKGKCWLEKTEDHFAKDKDLTDCHIALDSCQHPQPQN